MPKVHRGDGRLGLGPAVLENVLGIFAGLPAVGGQQVFPFGEPLAGAVDVGGGDLEVLSHGLPDGLGQEARPVDGIEDLHGRHQPGREPDAGLDAVAREVIVVWHPQAVGAGQGGAGGLACHAPREVHLRRVPGHTLARETLVVGQPDVFVFGEDVFDLGPPGFPHEVGVVEKQIGVGLVSLDDGLGLEAVAAESLDHIDGPILVLSSIDLNSEVVGVEAPQV